MKKKIFSVLLVLGFLFFYITEGYTQSLTDHQRFIYPIVRITFNNVGGSGSVIRSENIGGKYITYILTNHHVIAHAIRITEEWDSKLQKNIPTERKSTVYVEIFKYKDISIPIGTLKIEADIILYDAHEDLALLRLRSEEQIKDIVILPPIPKQYYVLDKTIAVGCSLGYPPLPTIGILTRKNVQVNSLDYHMSSSQIIYGNSGGAIFLLETGELIGIPSLVPVIGWGTPITHMGLFIPIERIYTWLLLHNIINITGGK